jgi:predicted Zn-ribbon and HTH transcriptional regulator
MQIIQHCSKQGKMCAVFRHSGVAASMHPLRHRRQHASIAASPPACIHCGIAASMHPLRQSRQHASIAASPPACIHCGIAASMHLLAQKFWLMQAPT